MATRVLLLAGAALSAGAVDEVTYGSASAAEAEEMMEPTPTKMSFKPPQLDEEESESRTVPAVYRCDVCAAVAYQIEEQFQRAEKNKSAKRKRRLSEMEILDILEEVCMKDNMEDYGIKGVTDAEPGKEKLLNGPGLPDAAGKMGVIQGGGQWPNRLVERCLEIVGEVGEDEIYRMYTEAEPVTAEKPEEQYAALFRELCEGADGTGDCGGGKKKKGGGKKAKKGKGKKKKKKKNKSEL